jgi:hypothetical protein
MANGVGRWRSCVRGLWESLSLSRNPGLALVMLQAPPVPDDVMRYLFDLLPEGQNAAEHPWRRHALVGLEDDRDRHLSEKVLQASDVLARLRQTLQGARQRGQVIEGLSCYASSERMAQLADALGLDLLATPPAALHSGGKAGGRRVFLEAGVPHPPGSYAIQRDLVDLSYTLSLLAARHGGDQWLVKIDDGYGSGHGNAVIDVDRAEAASIAEALSRRLRPLCPGVSRDEFLARLLDAGAIVEKFQVPRPGGLVRCPSVSALLHRNRHGSVDVEVLGTHEQFIGDGQEYLGCRFPAEKDYRAELIAFARPVFERLAARGALGHVGVDFLARSGSHGRPPWTLEALEVNLRQTGSTHPNAIVRALVDGEWRTDGSLIDTHGREVFYTGTDGLISTQYRGIPAADLVRALRASPSVSYDPASGRGVVPHLWTTLEPFGKLGATYIGRSMSDCADLQAAFNSLLAGLCGPSTFDLAGDRCGLPRI